MDASSAVSQPEDQQNEIVIDYGGYDCDPELDSKELGRKGLVLLDVDKDKPEHGFARRALGSKLEGQMETLIHEATKLPDDETRAKFFEWSIERFQEELHALSKDRKTSPPLPKKGEYPLYPGRVDVLKFLGDHWGQYLKYFGADDDYLYQDELKEFDPKLYRAIWNRFESKEKVGEIVPPRQRRTDKEIDSSDMESLRKGHRLSGALAYRQRNRL